jgi:uncharacterized coiled-coil protein SlyX
MILNPDDLKNLSLPVAMTFLGVVFTLYIFNGSVKNASKGWEQAVKSQEETIKNLTIRVSHLESDAKEERKKFEEIISKFEDHQISVLDVKINEILRIIRHE